MGAIGLLICFGPPPRSAAPPPPSPLPAGDYFRPYYSTCPCCPSPTVAVVAGVYDTEAAAATAVSRVPAGRLPLGYPLVLHSVELGLTDTRRAGIVVVVGLFADRIPAEAWRGKLGPDFPATTVEPLMDDASFEKSLADKLNPGTPPKSVVRVAPGRPVQAYAARELEDLGENPARGVLAKPKHPVCAVPPGSFFVGGERDFLFVYRWAPVRCGDELAYIPWQKTMLRSTVVPLGDGRYHLIQVTGIAMEDDPIYTEWLFDADGRHPLPPRLPRSQRLARRLATPEGRSCAAGK